MNPKDTPFMAFFLASVTFGVIAIDKVSDSLQNLKKNKFSLLPNIQSEKRKRVFYIVLAILGFSLLLFTIDRVFSNNMSRPLVNQLLEIVYKAKNGSIFYPLNLKIINGINQGIALDAYIEKAISWVNLFEFYFMAVCILIAAIYLFIKMPTGLICKHPRIPVSCAWVASLFKNSSFLLLNQYAPVKGRIDYRIFTRSI